MDTAITVVILVLTVQVTVCESSVIVGVTIESFTNPNGTCYVESSSDRKCCDGPERAQCGLGDTCDTYFDICVGRMDTNLGCVGAFFQTKPLSDTNVIGNLTMMESRSNFWDSGMSIFIFVRDDDSLGAPVIKRHEHIDTLIDEIKFVPSPTQVGAPQYHFELEGKTRLSLSMAVWCESDFYGQYCNSHCKGISPMAICESDGKLTCQPSDALILELKNQTRENQLPDLVYNTNRYIEDKVCKENNSKVLYPQLDPKSNTFTYIAYCGNHQVTPIEFESLLKLQQPSVLDTYFSAGVITGPAAVSAGYGEHIIPNVYLGVELKSLKNPTGTSYNGQMTNGKRRCCDVPRADNCMAADDVCDLQVSVCIGEQEKQARSLLETEVQNLRADIERVSRRHDSSQCQCPASKTVAFSATLTNDITSLGESQPIIFDKVITNTNGVYDSRHGAFRAPVSGTYKFSFSALQGTSAMWIALELVRNGTPIGRVRTGDYGYYAVGTNIVNVHLDAGDDVWVQHQGNLGSGTVKARGGGFTMFTGHLVKAD